jgi:hypothetical protein
MTGNVAVQQLSSVLHSASGASVWFGGNTQIEFASGGEGKVSHVFIVQGGEVKFGQNSTLICPPG